LPKHFDQDTTLRFGTTLQFEFAGYYSLDAHLGWKPVTNLELSIGGQNLLDNRHPGVFAGFCEHCPNRGKAQHFRKYYGEF